MLLLVYGLLRFLNSGFNELRDAIFARVRYHAMNSLSVTVLSHLHRLSLRYHLERNIGAISRDMERGTQSISSILNYLVFNIVPTMAEFLLVALILFSQYDSLFAGIIFFSVIFYIGFTLMVTEWRMHYRHEMNALDSSANGRAMDSLMNYETVKYFNNDRHEIDRYRNTMGEWEEAAVKSQTTMSMLNFGQAAIIAIGVSGIMFLAAQGVIDGELTLGDLVLINTMMLQLFLPLNLLGIIYRSLKYALADMDMVIKLLQRPVEIEDRERCRGSRYQTGQHRISRRRLSLQRGPAHSRAGQLQTRRRRKTGYSRAVGCRQVHHRAPVVSFLRHRPGADPDQWPGYRRCHTTEPARGHRHRAAGYRAV